MTEAELIEMLREAVKDKPVDWVLEDVEDEHNYYFRFILKENDLVLPDEMEAEKNRKMILAQADEIEILKRNVRELQGQLNSANIHNKNLVQRLTELQDIECFCGLAEEPVLATEEY